MNRKEIEARIKRIEMILGLEPVPNLTNEAVMKRYPKPNDLSMARMLLKMEYINKIFEESKKDW